MIYRESTGDFKGFNNNNQSVLLLTLYYIKSSNRINVNKPIIIVVLVSLFALLYQAAFLSSLPEQVILFLYLLSPFLLILMVYIVLKNGKPSAHSFDERFYDDWDYQRNGREDIHG